MNVLQLLIYLSIIVLIAGVIYRAIKISRMPVHLRWDLYPIPHEKGKEHYGGSYFEEINWWTKPLKFSLGSEVKEMSREIFLIQSLYRNNRPLWFFSFPFHVGLYFLIMFAFLLLLGAVLEIAGITIAAASGNIIPQLIYVLTMVSCFMGSVLGAFGAIGLFFSRLFKKDLRPLSTPSDYFNLILLAALFISCFAVWLVADRSGDVLRSFIRQSLLFKPASPVPSAVALQLILTAIFFIYLPFTHMTHFVGKYFTYHKVRWEDHPNIRGGKIEKAVVEALGYRLNWSAPHIKAGSTWAEAATDLDSLKKGEKK